MKKWQFMSRLALGSGAAMLVSASLQAQQAEEEHDRIHDENHDHAQVEEIVVTATPLARDVVEISQSATVLRGAALERELANNLGDTLGRLPGVANASFGQNVGRPVIRGLQGARVGVLSNNMTSSDASAVSQDHGVPLEPFIADQIEVLRGPATLLYGSGAIGGVVNVVTHSIPSEVPEQAFSGRAMVQADTAAGQRFAAARVDGGSGKMAFHANAFYRRSDDYEIPGEAEVHPDEPAGLHEDDGHEEHGHGVLENSFLDNQGGTMGASWIGSQWRFGASWSGYESDYGIPGGHGAEEHSEEDHDDPHEQEHDDEEHGHEDVTIALKSTRLDAEIMGSEPFSGFEQFKLKLARTDYRHTEFEGDEVGTVFTNDAFNARLELRHHQIGPWSGAFGGQYSKRDFSAEGAEAFVPPSETTTRAAFWLASLEQGDWQLDLGARLEHVDTNPESSSGISTLDGEPREREFSPLSVSLGVIWHVNDAAHLALNVASAERAPTDQELYAFGPHIASRTFEVGDTELGLERNTHYELAYRSHLGQLSGSLVLYLDKFSDYIYQQDLGFEEDELPVFGWTQQNADFKGAELELRYDFGRSRVGHWQAVGFADRVKATLQDGSAVPRLPPHRWGLGLEWDYGDWAADMMWIHASSQTRTADFETPTDGYDLLNAELSWAAPLTKGPSLVVFLKGQNLLDEEIRNSTSFLKDHAPQIGRNFILGLRTTF